MKLVNFVKSFVNNDEGQDLLEYALLVALIALVAIAAGVACQRYLGALLYETKSVDPGVIGLTLAVTITIAFAAILPAIRRALRVDPSAMLRAD